MAKILLISANPIKEKMSGPGLRYWEMAKVLGRYHQVTLVIPNQVELSGPNFAIERFDYRRSDLWKKNDIVISHYFSPLHFNFLLQNKKYVVMDFYNLVFGENLEMGETGFLKKNPQYCRKMFNLTLNIADYILCSGERQRDLIIGMLFSLGRLTPELYRRDPNLNGFLDIIGFGLPSQTPVKSSPTVKGVIPGIGSEDFLLLWAGGIWEWFDSISLVEAVDIAVRQDPKIKLLFMGCRAPVADSSPESKYQKTVEIAEQLGLLNKHIFFLDWVAYDKRDDYYLEADAGVSIHKDVLETRFSFRTRLMDYFWAGLPVICSNGDLLSEVVEKEQLGIVNKIGNKQEIAQAILTLASNSEQYGVIKGNIQRIRENYKWEKVMTPLLEFCSNPRFVTGKPGNMELLGDISKIYFDRLVLSNFRS